MHKTYIALALLMSLVVGTGFAISGNTVSAQNYEYDNNYSDNKYSKYQTQDKPYECQRGPFEGFYVSSVEFCKPNDDRHGDKDDFRHGDKDDDFKRFDFNFYVVTGEPSSESFGGAATLDSTAECDAGDEVTGGGFDLDSTPDTTAPPTNTGDADVTTSIPVENINGAGEGWNAIAQVEAQNSLEYTLTAYAVCFDKKPFQQEETTLEPIVPTM
jgi:hypothetical protein